MLYYPIGACWMTFDSFTLETYSRAGQLALLAFSILFYSG